MLQRLDGAVDVGLVVEDVRGDADGVVVFLWHASVLHIGVRALRWFEEDIALLQRRDDFAVAAAGERETDDARGEFALGRGDWRKLGDFC